MVVLSLITPLPFPACRRGFILSSDASSRTPSSGLLPPAVSRATSCQAPALMCCVQHRHLRWNWSLSMFERFNVTGEETVLLEGLRLNLLDLLVLLDSGLCWYLQALGCTVVGFPSPHPAGAGRAVLQELFTKIESNKNQQVLVFICTSPRCFLQFQAFCFDAKKQPVLRCQPSTSLRNHQVQQEGLSISVGTVQPAKIHSFHSTKRLRRSTGLLMLGMMSNGHNLYFTSIFFCLFKGAFPLDFYGEGNKHFHSDVQVK